MNNFVVAPNKKTAFSNVLTENHNTCLLGLKKCLSWNYIFFGPLSLEL